MSVACVPRLPSLSMWSRALRLAIAFPVHKLNRPGTDTVLLSYWSAAAGLPTFRSASFSTTTRLGEKMTDGSYKQFCPVAMAAETLCTRWTILLVRELIAGSTRFNDLRRGVPRMSPALLSKRLRDLESAGIVERTAVAGESGIYEYKLTKAGQELVSVIGAIGNWGQRWIESTPSLENLDPELLMWDMRRNLNTDPMPQRRSVILFSYPELTAARRRYWLIVEPGEDVDLCSVDPGFDVDLYVNSDLRTMTAIWMGLETVAESKQDSRLIMTGESDLEQAMQSWLGLSPFATVEKLVA